MIKSKKSTEACYHGSILPQNC